MKQTFAFSLLMYGIIVLCGQNSGITLSKNNNPADSLHTGLPALVLDEIYIIADSSNRDRSEALGLCRTTEDALEQLDGVSLIKKGNFAFEPALHGFNSGQVNLTIDGMKMFGACIDKMDPITSYVEKSNLKKIEVQTPSTDLFNGPNIGGGINLVTAKPAFNNAFAGALHSGFESSSSLKNLDGYLNYASTKTAFRFAFSSKSSGNYFAGNHSEVYNSGFHKQNYKFDAAYDFNNPGIIYISYILDIAHDVGYPAMIMDARKARSNIFSITLKSKTNELPDYIDSYELKVYTNNVHHWMDDYDRAISEIQQRAIMPGMYMPMYGNTATSGIHGNLSFKNSAHVFTIGVDMYSLSAFADMDMYSLTPDTPPMYLINIGDVSILTQTYIFKHAYFFSDLVNIQNTASIGFTSSDMQNSDAKKELSVYIGYLPHKRFFSTWNLSSLVTYSPTQKIILTGSVSRTMRTPTYQENFGYFLYNISDNAIYMGDPALQPEIAIQGMFSVSYANDIVKIKLAAFHSAIQHYITGQIIVPGDASNVLFSQSIKKYTNINKAYIQGIDFSAKINPLSNFEILVDLGYQFGKSPSAGDYLPFIAPIKGKISTIFGSSDLWCSGELNYESSQHNFSHKLSNESASPSFAVINLKGGMEITQNTDVQIGIENLLDTYYTRHININHIPEKGRCFFINISYEF